MAEEENRNEKKNPGQPVAAAEPVGASASKLSNTLSNLLGNIEAGSSPVSGDKKPTVIDTEIYLEQAKEKKAQKIRFALVGGTLAMMVLMFFSMLFSAGPPQKKTNEVEVKQVQKDTVSFFEEADKPLPKNSSFIQKILCGGQRKSWVCEK
jgi:hypothetical protein